MNYERFFHFYSKLLLFALIQVSVLLPLATYAQDSEPSSEIVIHRASICTAIVDREPRGSAMIFPSDCGRLFAFTQVKGGEGENIVHAWIHEGKTRARVELGIGSSNWRTHSSKRILPSWTGQWQLKVLSNEGLVLKTVSFSVEQ